MIVSRAREKLLNAILFFVQNTKHCHTLKLFKLLNALDFEHFRQTGRTVTDLSYKAWDKGPVPDDLWRELKKGGYADLQKVVSLNPVKDDLTDVLLRRDLKPRKQTDVRVFSKRELEIMKRIAEIFYEAKCDDMSDFSHDRRFPWRRVFGQGEGSGKIIEPELALDAPPLMDEPTIDPEELEFRRGLLAGL